MRIRTSKDDFFQRKFAREPDSIDVILCIFCREWTLRDDNADVIDEQGKTPPTIRIEAGNSIQKD